MKKWILLAVLLSCSVAVGAKNEWVLGGPQDTYEVEEWVIGQSEVNIDGTAAPSAEVGQLIMIMSSVPLIVVFVAFSSRYSGRKAV